MLLKEKYSGTLLERYSQAIQDDFFIKPLQQRIFNHKGQRIHHFSLFIQISITVYLNTRRQIIQLLLSIPYMTILLAQKAF